MEEHIEVLYRPSIPPEAAGWRGFEPGRTLLPAGSTYRPNGRTLECDVVQERDVAIRVSDGTILYADVFRPDTPEPVPAILAWSPYGKQSTAYTLDLFPQRVGVSESETSGLEKFEGPDPAFWCAHGYAVVNVDTRGAYASEGDIQFWSPQEAADGHDVVEWTAAQEWCSDAVTMSGNSWLGVSQWLIAATRPAHLVAIAPWEGFTDVYRDVVLWGGIPDLEISEQLGGFGRTRREDLPGMMAAYPLMNEYWRGKIMDIEAIDIPAYVVASWTNPFHVRGTLDAFSRLDPARSWLRVHNYHEWPDLYRSEADLLRFYDHVIKGVDNGWRDTPRVRLSVFDPGGTDVVNRPESEYPLARAVARAYHLDAYNGTMSDDAPTSTASTVFDATDGTAEFRYTFTEDTELTGPLALRVLVSTTHGDDFDLHVYVRKFDADGNLRLTEFVPGIPMAGNKGQLRASHRELDSSKSTPLAPVHAHEHLLPLAPDEIVALDIPIRPLGMLWHRGEQLQLLLSVRNLQTGAQHLGPILEVPFSSAAPDNQDSPAIRVHTGGDHDSFLLVSYVPAGV